MKRRSAVEQAKYEARMIANNQIGLRHRILAAREKNEIIPELEQRIDDAVENGEEFEIDAGVMHDLFIGVRPRLEKGE